MGIVNSSIFEFNEVDSYLVTIKYDGNGFYVNGILIDRDDFESVEPSKTPEWPNQTDVNNGEMWTYPDYFLPRFQSGLNLRFGSMEGSVRTWAKYNYIKYHKKI